MPKMQFQAPFLASLDSSYALGPSPMQCSAVCFFADCSLKHRGNLIGDVLLAPDRCCGRVAHVCCWIRNKMACSWFDSDLWVCFSCTEAQRLQTWFGFLHGKLADPEAAKKGAVAPVANWVGKAQEEEKCLGFNDWTPGHLTDSRRTKMVERLHGNFDVYLPHESKALQPDGNRPRPETLEKVFTLMKKQHVGYCTCPMMDKWTEN